MKVFQKLSSKITICYREALKTASELANLSYNFVLSENITLLKFWERMDPSELYVDIPLFCSIDIPLFCSKFSKFSFFVTTFANLSVLQLWPIANSALRKPS